jgi:hypothetical protein
MMHLLHHDVDGKENGIPAANGDAPNPTEVSMTGYEIVFDDDAGATSGPPQPGDTLDLNGGLWEVSRVETDGPTVRVHVTARPSADVAAHRRSAPVTLAPPTSFETELVYTLNDLSSRLSILASTLNAYWGKGAA